MFLKKDDKIIITLPRKYLSTKVFCLERRKFSLRFQGRKRPKKFNSFSSEIQNASSIALFNSKLKSFSWYKHRQLNSLNACVKFLAFFAFFLVYSCISFFSPFGFRFCTYTFSFFCFYVLFNYYFLCSTEIVRGESQLSCRCQYFIY